MYDKKQKVIILLHCGWRGLDKNIIEKALEIMNNEFNSQESNIKVAIGPGICKDCYEIGNDLKDKFKKYSRAIIRKDKKTFFDLKKVAEMKLIQGGIIENNIEISRECTSCLKETYFSYRRDNLKNSKVMIVLFRMIN